MKRDEMTKIVKSELEHIPKGDKGSPQNELRLLYNARRRRDLVKTSKVKEETLQDCVKTLKEKYPNFVPTYNENFFKMPKAGPLQRIIGWIKG